MVNVSEASAQEMEYALKAERDLLQIISFSLFQNKFKYVSGSYEYGKGHEMCPVYQRLQK